MQHNYPFIWNKNLDLCTSIQQWLAFIPHNTTTLCFATVLSCVEKKKGCCYRPLDLATRKKGRIVYAAKYAKKKEKHQRGGISIQTTPLSSLHILYKHHSHLLLSEICQTAVWYNHALFIKNSFILGVWNRSCTMPGCSTMTASRSTSRSHQWVETAMTVYTKVLRSLKYSV